MKSSRRRGDWAATHADVTAIVTSRPVTDELLRVPVGLARLSRMGWWGFWDIPQKIWKHTSIAVLRSRHGRV